MKKPQMNKLDLQVLCASSSRGKPKRWSDIDWKKVIASVNRLQKRIAEAVEKQRYHKAKALMYLLTKSFNAKLLSVYRVSTLNRGKSTPGADSQIWNTNQDKLKAAKNLKIRGYKPLPLKRIYIPKKNGKKRPLSIPCMQDRAMQTLFGLALEPWAETTADRDSYGFRRKRCCQDAIGQCFLSLCRKTSAQWIFEADIKACFDELNHAFIMQTVPINKNILNKWLKAGFIEHNKWNPSVKGTPQGGTISPMIMNMVLDGLQKELDAHFPKWKNLKVNLIRYADDFIITAKNKPLIEEQIIPVVESFLQKRGLQLSEEKSKITHIKEGFDFLGQTIRNYKDKVIIKPSKASVQSFKNRIKTTVKSARGLPAHALIAKLNPVIRGWANYHKACCAKHTFYKLSCFIYHQIKRWCRRSHGNKGRWWIYNRYFKQYGGFSDIIKEKKTQKVIRLFEISRVPIKYHIKIKAKANPYLNQFDTYFQKRKAYKEILKKNSKQITTFVCK